MMREPWFWRSTSASARATRMVLSPLSALYDVGQRARAAMAKPQRAPVPIVCVGNATLGGVGKTPFAIALASYLMARGLNVHFLTRGYGGRLRGPIKVDVDKHSFQDVGDEALLLARIAPTWVSADRPAGANNAAPGADVIIMDDGFQNPTIHKDCSILLTGEPTLLEAKIFPAGPMREPLSRAIARADIQIEITPNAKCNSHHGNAYLAYIAPAGAPSPQRVVAFCGIGTPAKFFRTLKELQYEIAEEVVFADHHPYSTADIKALNALSAAQGAPLITTEKDAVRLPRDVRDDVATLPIVMEIQNADRLIDDVLEAVGR